MTAEHPGERAPRATYRLQLGPGLDFHAAAGLVDYLADLGVTHLYCSPVLQAREGSPHGYDVTDPTTVSRALGGADGLHRLAEAAAERGLGLVIDLVPNHMGIGPDNPYWEDLLAQGPTGRGGAFFDVDWAPSLPGAEGKVIVPVLGAPYGDVLLAGELKVVDGDAGPRVRYHDHSFPLSPASREAFQRSADPASLAGTPGRAETWSRLHGLLEAQHYRLVHWRAGDALVNYRRFFAINELAAVRVEDGGVFDEVHGRVLDLVRGGVVDGLRIDHVDGLADPAGYLTRLRQEAGDAWIVVEKILAPDETLPPWPVDGTTGYDFLADALALFVDPAAEDELTEVALAFDAWAPHEEGSFDALAAAAKREVLARDLAADTERLVDRFWALTQEHLEVRDVTRLACREAVASFVAALDVYRPYTLAGAEPAPADADRIAAAVARARSAAYDVPGFLWAFLQRVLEGRAGDGALHAEVLRRAQQLASAAMAKGVEDTLLYRQHRLAALNEVGVEPNRFGTDVAAFHEANARRAAHHPQGMLTTSTHDTKRGEDVRLRIAALSECPGTWRDAVGRWLEAHRSTVTATGRGPAPDPPIEYLCYQTLVGVWTPDAPDTDDVRDRVTAFLVKAAREDGRRTSWTDPDEDYERGLAGFVAHLMDRGRSGAFLDDLSELAGRTGEIAMTSSLAQVLLRTTSPGVPDTYQGLELWGDNLVDPDNRRPVDFAGRRRLLAALDAEPPDLDELVARRADGRVKLWVLSRALRARLDLRACFGADGGYVPLPVRGRFADRVVAFARTGPAGEAAVTVAPRLVGAVIEGRPGPPIGELWDDTCLELPEELSTGPWRDALGGPGAPAGASVALHGVLSRLPVALLVRGR